MAIVGPIVIFNLHYIKKKIIIITAYPDMVES